MHDGQRLVGFLAGAEQDRLLDLGGAGEALEGPVAGGGAQHRAGVSERLQCADQQRPLAVEQADGALAVHPPRHRAAGREVVVGIVVAVRHWCRECYLGSADSVASVGNGALEQGRRLSPLVQLVRGEDLVEVLAGERLALERVGRQIVEAFAVGGEQGAGAAVGLAGQLHRRQVDVAAGAVRERVVAGRQGDRRRPVGVDCNSHAELADHLLADGVHPGEVVDWRRSRSCPAPPPRRRGRPAG